MSETPAMGEIRARIAVLHEQGKGLYKAYQDAKDACTVVTASVGRLEMILFAEAHPLITSFGIEGDWQSDDEGGTFYSPELTAYTGDAEAEEFEPYDFSLEPEDFTEDDLFDIAHEFDEDAAAAIFGDSSDGTISVVQLRAEVGV